LFTAFIRIAVDSSAGTCQRCSTVTYTSSRCHSVCNLYRLFAVCRRLFRDIRRCQCCCNTIRLLHLLVSIQLRWNIHR
jgi:hypothetical protein